MKERHETEMSTSFVEIYMKENIDFCIKIVKTFREWAFWVFPLNVHFPMQVPFREAHSLSGKCVALAENKGCPLSSLSVQELKSVW